MVLKNQPGYRPTSVCPPVRACFYLWLAGRLARVDAVQFPMIFLNPPRAGVALPPGVLAATAAVVRTRSLTSSQVRAGRFVSVLALLGWG